MNIYFHSNTNIILLYYSQFISSSAIIQFTRDALIVLAGSKAKGRDFVYFTEVKNIPSTDLATIERLWTKFSGGKFGYSVQKVRFYIEIFNSIQFNVHISNTI